MIADRSFCLATAAAAVAAFSRFLFFCRL